MGSPSKQTPVELVKESDLENLMGIFFKQSFYHNASDAEMAAAFEGIQQKCVDLFSKDYTVKIIDNKDGSLSSSYPDKIVSLALPADDGDDQEARAEELRQRMKKARTARAWTRFVVPVILFDGKHICRSATLSGGVEIYTRMAAEKVYDASANLYTYLYSMVADSTGNTPTSSLEASQESTVCPDKHEDSAAAALSSLQGEVEDEPSAAVPMAPEDDASVHSELRNEDIQLLKSLSINQICDLMVEKKKQKFCMNLTSSEKIDKFNRYRDFTIFQLPFPGCEFFEEYSTSGYKARHLIFDWSQEWIDAELQVPDNSLFSELNINWEDYKAWDLLTLTKNYMKLLLTTIANSDSGLLVHCISGWDRTPTFISMIRLSLWADNRIHQNLSPLEMAYLTVAYDWFLFSHNLALRLKSKQEIFHFCFKMLKYIKTKQFSMATLENPKKNVQCHQAPPPDEPAKNGASAAATAIPVITPSPPEDELYFSCTSIPSGSPVQGASGDERPSTGPDSEKEPANGASTVASNDGDTSSRPETANGRDLLSVGRPVTPLASPTPAVGSPSNGSDNAGRTEDDETRNIQFLLKRRAQRLKEVRRLVRRFYANNKSLLSSPPSL